MTVSIIAPRYKCAAVLRKVARDDGSGRTVVTNVKLTRVALLTWHLEFKAERSDI